MIVGDAEVFSGGLLRRRCQGWHFSLFFLRNSFNVSGHLTNDRAVIELFFINDFTVHDTGLREPFPDIHRINIIQIVIFSFRIKPVGSYELGNTSLHLWPRQIRGCIAHGNGERR
ncbi:hypothetical protein SDC9_183155 [bioreactor metagenome]|uniref:Uncharacterized protein n=1 Tax=bioreactor metagenome TaxID=1076179 RepID=A0A645H9H8_9ZZZZ